MTHPAPEGEVALAGGHINTVVRVGDTVRRTAGPWTAHVHDLLRHVRERGFSLASEPLGVDSDGREVLRFVAGDTVGAALPWPAWVWSDELLVEVGQALRAFHDAVADHRPAGPIPWRLGPATLGAGEILCHNDLSPTNVVASGGHLAGILDWDLVGPANPIWDLAHVAWQWAPLFHPDVASRLGWTDEGRVAPRLSLLCDAYCLQAAGRSALVGEARRRVTASRAGILAAADAGVGAFVRLRDAGHTEDMARTIDHLRRIGPRLTAAIT